MRCCRDRYINLMGEAKAGLYDAMERLVLAARPDFAPEVDYMRSHADHYLCNMFVMPRVQFFEYCEFIFPILFELVRLNADEHDVHGVRAPGFLSEFLTSIYLAHLVREGRLRIKPLRLACWGIPAHGFLRYVIRSILPDGVRHWLKKRLRIN